MCVFDLMEDVLPEIGNPNVVLETIPSQKSYLNLKPAKKETAAKRAVEVAKLIDKIIYKDYNDQAREVY